MKQFVVHCKKSAYDVYIGRPSIWGNPFSHQNGTLAEFKVETRELAVIAYHAWILGSKNLMAKLPELKGKILGCWCAPKECHGDVLAELANSYLPEPFEIKPLPLEEQDLRPYVEDNPNFVSDEEFEKMTGAKWTVVEDKNKK